MAKGSQIEEGDFGAQFCRCVVVGVPMAHQILCEEPSILLRRCLLGGTEPEGFGHGAD